MLNAATPAAKALAEGLRGYQTHLALTLLELGRTSSDVVQHEVTTSGTIRGERFDRTFLMEEWLPPPERLADYAVLVSPGFQMGVENYSKVAAVENARGVPALAFNPSGSTAVR